MRELRSIGFVLAVALVAWPAASWGVELDTEGCQYYIDFNAGGAGLASLFTLLGIEGIPANWAEWDYELVGGEDGDGILDQWQMGMLAAVLCSPAKEGADLQLIKEQYATNMGMIGDLMLDIEDIVTAVPRAVDLMVGNPEGEPPTIGIIPGLLAIPEIQGVVTDWPDPGDTLADSLVELTGLMAEIGEYVDLLPMITILFEEIGPWMAGMGGLSTEMQDRVDDLLLELEGFLGDFAELAGLLQVLLDNFGPGGAGFIGPELAAEMEEMIALAATITITPPPFIIYGSTPKTADEPFSAFGDFDDDGTTNQVVYDGIVASGGGVVEFVAAATGSNPWWPGNPNLPAAGFLGLGLLASAIATGGAFVLRKRS